ncbi:MAG: DUF167 domain-containing protein [Chloroflexi bacterium]|nr:DUF167 domain-containing protein [Chloroflexota bacterium]
MELKVFTIRVHVRPNASRSEVVGQRDGVWHVRVAAPPVEGKANSAMIVLLSERLRMSKSRLRILRGERGRDKLVAIEGGTEEEISRCLSREVDGA